MKYGIALRLIKGPTGAHSMAHEPNAMIGLTEVSNEVEFKQVGERQRVALTRWPDFITNRGIGLVRTASATLVTGSTTRSAALPGVHPYLFSLSALAALTVTVSSDCLI